VTGAFCGSQHYRIALVPAYRMSGTDGVLKYCSASARRL